MQNNLAKFAKKALGIILSAFVWFGLWKIAYKKVGTELLVPSPKSVFNRLLEFLNQKEFYDSVLLSFTGIAKGYLLGILVGTVIGIIISFSKILSAVFRPLLTAIKSTPVVSFIILTLLWIKRDDVSTFITFLMVMPIITAGVFSGIKSADSELLEMAKAYKFSFWKKLKYIYLSSASTSFTSACETSIGLAWKAGIAAEVICRPDNTIGKLLKDSQIYLETIDLFTWTVVVIIISLILEKLLVAIFDFILKKAINKGGYFIEHKNK